VRYWAISSNEFCPAGSFFDPVRSLTSFMMNKKSQLGIILIIILILIVIFAILFSLAMINKKAEQKTESINYINLYIKSIDSKSKENIETFYSLESNNTIISKGVISDWTEFQVDSSQEFNLFCWNKDHYTKEVNKIITFDEKNLNSSKIICESEKIGKVEISHAGNLNQDINLINLNIFTEDKLSKLEICESHTSGILSVNLEDEILKCEFGSWKNWIQINYTTNEPIILPNNSYMCGIDWETKCEKVNGIFCYLKEENIPNRLINKVDKCFYIGRNILNNSINISFKIETFNKNSKDYVEFYIIDSDKKFINNWIFVNEINENNQYIDVGGEDKIYKINYLQ
jgi:hypothetical protein